MQVPVNELVGEFMREARVNPAAAEEDLFLQALLDDFQSSSAMFKRDMRRLLEKDPAVFLRSACRVLKGSPSGPGQTYMMELLWSNPVLQQALIDPEILPLPAAIGFAKRWVEYDPMLDIKLLHMGFPADGGAVCELDISRAKRVLAMVSELPARRHLLLPLVSLLRSPDVEVRSKAATLYGRAAKNAEWVRNRLGELDARVRANAVESLWGEQTDAALAVLRDAARDHHHRVAANALIGLHQTGQFDVGAILSKMAEDSDPLARAAAAFAMGRVAKPEFRPSLEGLLKDDNALVRGQALRALVRMRRDEKQRDAASYETAPAEVPAAEEKADGSPAATEAATAPVS